MSKQKTTQLPYQQTNTYSWETPPETQDVKDLRETKVTNEFLEPALQAQFDRNKQKVRSRLESSYNQNIPQAVRENTALQANNELAADYGTALAQGDYNNKQAELQKKYALAGMTRPQMVQSGQSGYTSQVKQGSGFWGQLGGAALTAGLGMI